MSKETDTPSAAVLRQLSTSIASDLAHAPLKSKNHEKLSVLTKRFLVQEKAMAATSEMVDRAIGNAKELIKEAEKWESIAEEEDSIVVTMQESVTRISGRRSLVDVGVK